MMHDVHDDMWAEFHRRREEWRAQRDARRKAWRARRDARRAAWGLGGGSHGCGSAWGSGWGMSAADWGMGAPSESVDELKARLADMEKTIAQLSERIIVLEKLATDDDSRLAAEIEKLRGEDK
jgi:hypothetical protein